MRNNVTYYTKSLKDDSPKGGSLIHMYAYGLIAMCGLDIKDNGRWAIEHSSKKKVNCKRCVELGKQVEENIKKRKKNNGQRKRSIKVRRI